MTTQKAKGVVAAGDRLTAAAGAEVLAHGGNAVDAAIASMTTAFVSEPALTGPLGGGFAVVAGPKSPPKAYHFFANAPRQTPSALNKALDFHGLEVDFGSTTQTFHVGKGAAAVPLILEGIKTLHHEQGRLALKEVLSQCRTSASHGIPLSKGQLNFIRVLTPILSLTPESRALFIDEVEENGQVIFPGLVRLIDALIDDRLDEIYNDLAEHFSSPVGQLSHSDFQELKVESCSPLIIPFRDNEIIMPGLPTSAGALIAFGLELWSRSPVPSDLASFHQQFAAVASLTMDYRINHFDPLLRTENAVWDRDSIDFRYWETQLKKRLDSASIQPSPMEKDGNGSTTHVSVVDSDGMACAITTSNGEGCGHIVPGWDVMANNFMGESDLHPNGFHTSHPGQALTSMMCPTIIRSPHGMYALGTGGSNRIRTALLQIIYRLLVLGQRPDEAVAAPRAHFEGELFCYEVNGSDGQVGIDLRDKRYFHDVKLAPFPQSNMYFGGVHIASPHTTSVGDLRRYGAVATSSR